MQLKMVVAFFAGSVLVHAAVTACTSTSTPFASADPAAGATEVSAEPCNAEYQMPPGPHDPTDAGTRTVRYSEHAYPGKTKFEIAAHVTHWMPIADNKELFGATAPGYDDGLRLELGVSTRDGFAMAGCTEGKISYFVWR